MPNYHLGVTTFSRGKGKSAQAAAAYRAAQRVIEGEEKDNTLEHASTALAAAAYRSAGKLEQVKGVIVHDYTRRQKGVVHTEILHPEDVPKWVSDRSRLWNEADRFEKRVNSVVAREVQVSLPHELSSEQRKDLARALGQYLVERYQVAVDLAIHLPPKHGDERNHHAHLLMTTRRVSKEGFTEKTRELDDRMQGKEVKHLRETWAAMVNEALEGAGKQERVDHRSLEAQGILDRKPQVHLGKAANLERRGVYTRPGDRQRYVEHKNALAGYQKAPGQEVKEKIEESMNQVRNKRQKKPEKKLEQMKQDTWERKLDGERKSSQKLAR